MKNLVVGVSVDVGIVFAGSHSCLQVGRPGKMETQRCSSANTRRRRHQERTSVSFLSHSFISFIRTQVSHAKVSTVTVIAR